MSSPEDTNYNCKDCESKFKSIKELDDHEGRSINQI